MAANAPVAVIAAPWLNPYMTVGPFTSSDAEACFDERLRSVVKHEPVEKPE